jgi:outer membrane protein
MKRRLVGLAAFVLTWCTQPAYAANDADLRTLTMADAVDLAIRSDPAIDEALNDRDRTKNATLRSQLDRISFRIDGQLQELWNKANIGGPPQGLCTIAGQSAPTDRPTCATYGGMFVPGGVPTAFTQGLFNLVGNLQVPVFAGFRIDATVKRAQRNEEAAIVQIKRQRRDIALAASRAFWSVRRTQMLLEVAQETLQRIADSERVAGARVTAGLAPQIDKNRAMSRRLQQVSSVLEFEGQIEEAMAQLAVSLGIKPNIRLQGGFTFPDLPAPSAEEILEIARRDRPELRAAHLQTEAARQSVRIAQSNYYPQLSLIGLFQYGNNQLSIGTGARDVSSAENPFAGLSGDLTLGATLNYNFFNMLTDYTTTRDAKYEVTRLLAEERRAARAVDADVLAARARVQRFYSRRAPLQEAVAIARDNAKILEARYKNGDALVIELLDSQVELSTAESSLVDVEAQLELAWLELRAAMGEQLGRQ